MRFNGFFRRLFNLPFMHTLRIHKVDCSAPNSFHIYFIIECFNTHTYDTHEHHRACVFCSRLSWFGKTEKTLLAMSLDAIGFHSACDSATSLVFTSFFCRTLSMTWVIWMGSCSLLRALQNQNAIKMSEMRKWMYTYAHALTSMRANKWAALDERSVRK